jgi:hypothetical protein
MFLNSVAEESRAFFATAVDAGGLVTLGDTGHDGTRILIHFVTSQDERYTRTISITQLWGSANATG